ncbi:hypothetical protein [Bacillus litorisediminis]|nr:hypothetical protein [Bacillus litorisediminis]
MAEAKLKNDINTSIEAGLALKDGHSQFATSIFVQVEYGTIVCSRLMGK